MKKFLLTIEYPDDVSSNDIKNLLFSFFPQFEHTPYSSYSLSLNGEEFASSEDGVIDDDDNEDMMSCED